MLPPALRRRLEKNRGDGNSERGEQPPAEQSLADQTGDRPTAPGPDVFDPIFAPEALLVQDAVQHNQVPTSITEDAAMNLSSATPAHTRVEPLVEAVVQHYADYLNYPPAAPRPAANTENHQDWGRDRGDKTGALPPVSGPMVTVGPDSKSHVEYNINPTSNYHAAEYYQLGSATSSWATYQAPQAQPTSASWSSTAVHQLPQAYGQYSLLAGQEQTFSTHSRTPFVEQRAALHTRSTVPPHVSINNINMYQAAAASEWQRQGLSCNAVRPEHQANALNMMPGPSSGAIANIYASTGQNHQGFPSVANQELPVQENANPPPYHSHSWSDASQQDSTHARTRNVGKNKQASAAARRAAAAQRQVPDQLSSTSTPSDAHTSYPKSGANEATHSAGRCAPNLPMDFNQPSQSQFGPAHNASQCAGSCPGQDGGNRPRFHPYGRANFPINRPCGVPYTGLQPQADSAFTPTPSQLQQLQEHGRFFRYSLNATLNLSSAIGDFVQFLSRVAEAFNREAQLPPECAYPTDFFRPWRGE